MSEGRCETVSISERRLTISGSEDGNSLHPGMVYWLHAIFNIMRFGRIGDEVDKGPNAAEALRAQVNAEGREEHTSSSSSSSSGSSESGSGSGSTSSSDSEASDEDSVNSI
ncbi:hypothetical protein RIF29_41325 [Crotalaria pallida]|uniref:Uncharacterized protein n=1 Tax=Crotalaria pallida TaxID=3830 RepID=A0AAN9EB15_CROPI